jgi:site-specific DNA-methyltransferase (adenine-specific)
MTMFLTPSQISIGPRQRKKIESQPLADLQESVRQRGLLHPPTFRPIQGEPCSTCDGIGRIRDKPENPCVDCLGLGNAVVWQLIVGERRTKAMMNLIKAGIRFSHAGELVPEGQFPAFSLGENFSRAELKQIEFDENKIREALPWQDEVEALAEIHRLREEENPGQTRIETARQLIAENVIETHTNAVKLSTEIFKATAISDRLSDPKIANARNKTEAYNLILKGEEEAINASIAKRRIAATDTLPTIRLLQGDCTKLLAQQEPATADLILSDPPFGIGADSGGFRQRTVHHHNYKDTPENARAIAQSIIFDGFRVAKQQANLFLFCDIELFFTLREMAGRVGWTPWRTPIIWQKSLSEGMAPWQGKGFRRTYEVLFWATKGQRGLIASPVDILQHNRVKDTERTHAAEKPVDLLEKLIECSTLPGDFVLDPCCGSGSTLVAARNLKRTGLGIELDETFYNTSMSRVYAEPKTDAVELSTSDRGLDIDTLA